MIRRWDTDENVFMWSFDLLELNGDDLRRDPLNVRKATLASCSRERRQVCDSMGT
jgi:ATP-dependent DNA ligase